MNEPNTSLDHSNVVDRGFLARPSVEVAPELLGCLLRHETSEGAVAVRISEGEAYMGAADPGSHAYRGQTARNAVMFGEAGRLYVYRHLGLHHCVNIVCGHSGTATGVLVRAGEVVEGLELARQRRKRAGVTRHDADLARGPGRLSVALGLDLQHNGTDLVDSPAGVTVHYGVHRSVAVTSGARVGVSGDGGDGQLFPWRFWFTADPTVSAYRKHKPKNPSP